MVERINIMESGSGTSGANN